MDFTRIKEDVGEEFCKLHAKKAYFDIITPDFISYNIRDLNAGIKRLCEERNIPLLGWTVKDEDMQQLAYDFGCDNIVIEESKTYI